MRTITNIDGNLNRDITNGANLDILEADLPLQIVIDTTGESNDTINLGGLSSFGTTGQVMKVNSDADGLEWADDDDTTYSGGTNISIDQTNAINLDSTITLDRLNMTQGNAIFFKGSNDLNHYIKYVNDGLELGGFGSNNAPCFQVVNTKPLNDPQPGVPIPVFQVYRDKIISKQKLDMSSQPIYFKDSDLNHYIKYQSTEDCVQIAGFGSSNAPCFQIYSTGDDDTVNPPVVPETLASYYRGFIEFNKDLYMNDNTIYLHVTDGVRDPNHYLKYVNDGLELGGFGSNNAPCFQVVNTKPLNDPQPGVPIPVFQVYRDKIISKQKLDMSSQPIYFKDSDLNHYIKYQSTGDCLELASYSDGANDDVVFQFVNKAVTSGDPNLVLINKENNFFVKTTNFQSDVSIKNAKKMIFNDSSSITQSNYIKFNDTYDSMEISGSGLGNNSSVLRIISPNSTPDVLADFELSKTTFEKVTIFNSDVTVNTNLCVNTDFDVLGVSTFDSNATFNGDLTVNQVLTCDYLFVNLTVECESVLSDLVISDFINVSDDVRIGKKLHMRDNFSLGEINMADGRIYWRNGYKTGTNTYATDLNHFSTYSGGPVDGIRHQGWNGVALGYTNGGPGTALYTNGSGVFLGNGSPVTSDDRIKFNETKITGDALTTINKLVVVEYDKRYNRDLPETQYNAEMENHLLNDTPQKEYGYIAQDTWNDIPELRFTIKGVDESIPENFVDGRLIEDCKIRNKNPEGEEFIDRKYLSIDYNNINVLNVRAVQELSQIVRQQQAQIDRQQAQIEMLLKFNNLDIE